MPGYTGGTRITRARWLSPAAIVVDFESSYTLQQYQLYAGRSLIGFAGPGANQILGQLSPSLWPPRLQIVAVDAEDAETDYGAQLPLRPYNSARLRWSTSGYPSDADRFEITAGTAPGGAVDDSNVVGTVLFDANRTYTFDTPPLPGSGEWHFEIVPRDNRRDDGNAGTPLAVSLDLHSHPPDVVVQADGSRLFDFSIAAQSLAVSVELP